MQISRIRWWRYRIPFRSPFVTAHGTLTHRDGALLQLVTDTDASGVGEIAPLPGFGGSLDRLWPMLPDIAGRLPGMPMALDAVARRGPGQWTGVPAAVRCGVESALLDLAAQAAGCSLAALLTPRPGRLVPVNATVAVDDVALAVQQAAQAVRAGFGTVKLKVGTRATVAAEVDRIAAVRAAIGPATRLRLDANGAWTPDLGIAVIRACAPCGPEWVEQPVPAADIAGLARVRRAVGTPIAADESVTGEEAVQALLAAAAADVLVLKPMLAGGPLATLRLAGAAKAAGAGVVVTSMLESGAGIAAALQVAAALPTPPGACGLATAGLLADDLLVQPLGVRDGAMPLPAAPGLGVQVDWARLEHYVVAAGELAAP